MKDFQDKVAIVTGGASGIGRALCEELSRRGAFVVAADINREGAEELAAAIKAQGGRCRAAFLDVTQEEEVRKLIADTANKHGRLDYMFNNAGIAILGEVQDMTPEQWRRIIAINQMGVIYGTIAAYALMIKQGSGHIVNTASSAGIYRYSLCTAYSATKHAVVGLSTSLRSEAAGLGVKVTVVCPGPVDTNILNAATFLKMKPSGAYRNIPFTVVKADKAARIILRGVRKNRDLIVFPFYTRINWWLYRMFPGALALQDRIFVKGFRAVMRKEKSL